MFLLFSVALLVATAASSPAQCCLGARNLSAESVGGEFRVDAKSLTGTGIDVHGPYHYRFGFSRRTTDGDYEEQSSFEWKWETTTHFTMELFVSPTGNGFAVEFPTDQLTFFRNDGEKLFESAPGHPVRVTDDGYSVILCRSVRMRHSGSYYLEHSRVFLPLGALVTDRLSDQVMWLLQLDQRQLAGGKREIAESLEDVASDDATRRAAGRRALLYYAYLSIHPVQAALAKADDAAHRQRLTEILSALRMWKDRAGTPAWRDLPLLLSLCAYPDEMIRRRAKWRVVWLLSPKFRAPFEKNGTPDRSRLDQALEWVRTNQDRLRWDETERGFVMRER